jgi:hypothetical protein
MTLAEMVDELLQDIERYFEFRVIASTPIIWTPLGAYFPR